MSESKKIFLRGTAVKIVTELNIDTATSAKITIEDPTEAVKVNEASMTKDADGFYSYVYQTSTTDLIGMWIITIAVTYGGYTSLVQDTFELFQEE